MSEIYNAKESDWTCPNCEHQSPANTFEIIEKLEEKLKLKTMNEVQSSINADCLDGCRLILKKINGKLDKAEWILINIDGLSARGKLQETIDNFFIDNIK